MGFFDRLEIGLSAAVAWLGLVDVPADDAERSAEIATTWADYRVGFAEVPEVDVETLQHWLDGGTPVVLVDVRSDEERAVSMLPGAVSAATVEADPEAFRGRVLVAYCTIGYRSGLWARQERELGLDVRNLAGSVLAWTHTGRELAGPEGPTRRVHVYGPRWDLARNDYDAIW